MTRRMHKSAQPNWNFYFAAQVLASRSEYSTCFWMNAAAYEQRGSTCRFSDRAKSRAARVIRAAIPRLRPPGRSIRRPRPPVPRRQWSLMRPCRSARRPARIRDATFPPSLRKARCPDSLRLPAGSSTRRNEKGSLSSARRTMRSPHPRLTTQPAVMTLTSARGLGGD